MGKTEERNRMDIAGFCPEIVNRISNGNEPAGIGKNPDACRLFFVENRKMPSTHT